MGSTSTKDVETLNTATSKDEKNSLPAPSSSSPTPSLKDEEAPQQPAGDSEREYLTGVKLFIVVVAVTLVIFLVLLDMSIIVTAIPSITTQFHSLPDIGWYGSSYQIASAALQPLTGRIYTSFSSKWTFLGFFFIFELGSLLCGVANSSMMLIVSRAIAGLGSSGLMNGALTIVSSSVPLHKSPPLIGIMMGCTQLGVVFGPLLGGAFTEYATWRWCFYLNLPIGAVVAILLFFIHIPDQAAKPSASLIVDTILHQLDLIGFTLFAPSAIQLLLALQYGKGEYGYKSSTVIGLFCGAGCTFIVFLLWEYRQGDRAMIPLSMVRRRVIWASCLFIGALFGTVVCGTYYLPVYFQSIKNVSPMLSGVYMLPSILPQLLFSILSGHMVGKLGYYLPWAIFSGIAMSISNGLISTFAPSTPTAKWAGYQVLLGVGRGSGYQMPMVAVQNNVPPAQISIAMSLLMFCQTLSGAVFLTLGDVLFSSGLKSLVPQDAPGVDVQTIIGAGATGIRSVVAGEDLAGVLRAYAKSVDYVFYMAAALGVCCFVFAWGLGWKDIRKKGAAGEKA